MSLPGPIAVKGAGQLRTLLRPLLWYYGGRYNFQHNWASHVLCIYAAGPLGYLEHK